MLSALYYLFLIALCTLFMLLSAVALVICWPFDKGRRVVHELSRILVRTFFFVPLRWRQKVVGLEYVDRKKQYVIVLNHNTVIDIPALYYVPLNFRWVSKREVFKTPFSGSISFCTATFASTAGGPLKRWSSCCAKESGGFRAGPPLPFFLRARGRKTGKSIGSKPVLLRWLRRPASRFCQWCWTGRNRLSGGTCSSTGGIALRCGFCRPFRSSGSFPPTCTS